MIVFPLHVHISSILKNTTNNTWLTGSPNSHRVGVLSYLFPFMWAKSRKCLEKKLLKNTEMSGFATRWLCFSCCQILKGRQIWVCCQSGLHIKYGNDKKLKSSKYTYRIRVRMWNFMTTNKTGLLCPSESEKREEKNNRNTNPFYVTLE